MKRRLLPARWSWLEPGDPTRLTDPHDRPDDDTTDRSATDRSAVDRDTTGRDASGGKASGRLVTDRLAARDPGTTGESTTGHRDGPARGYSGEAGGDKPRVCAYCAQSLEACPACGDDWRRARCGNCSLGLRCPTHHSYWIAR